MEKRKKRELKIDSIWISQNNIEGKKEEERERWGKRREVNSRTESRYPANAKRDNINPPGHKERQGKNGHLEIIEVQTGTTDKLALPFFYNIGEEERTVSARLSI